VTATRTHDRSDAQISIRWLSGEDSSDTELVGRLTDLINDVYLVAERGLWQTGATRTTASELAELIAAGEIAIAEQDGQPVGAVQLRDVASDIAEFGMLVADPDRRGIGIGRALVDFVEQDGIDRQMRVMQLELLVPRDGTHPSKEFLKGWYGRRGYRLVRTTTLEDTHPHLAARLALPCVLGVHQKPLTMRGHERAEATR
jgi:GNAT superfamily N-acetyltransferase